MRSGFRVARVEIWDEMWLQVIRQMLFVSNDTGWRGSSTDGYLVSHFNRGRDFICEELSGSCKVD